MSEQQTTRSNNAVRFVVVFIEYTLARLATFIDRQHSVSVNHILIRASLSNSFECVRGGEWNPVHFGKDRYTKMLD